MSHKTFHHITLAIALTTTLTTIKLSSQAQAIPPGSPTRQRDGSTLNTRQDAYRLGHTTLTHIWRGTGLK